MRCTLLAGLALLGMFVCVRIHVADGLYREGRAILESNGDPVRAAERFEGALEIGTDDPLYALRRGAASLALGSREERLVAVSWFRQAARLAPIMARHQYWWGATLESLGETETALVRYEVARRLAPYNVDLNRRIADSYLRHFGRTRSREDLRRAFETIHALRLVEPEATSQALLRLLSRPLLRYEDLDAAVPRTAEARRTLAETLAAAGRFRWVVRAYDEADRLAGANGALSIRGRMLKYEDTVEKYPAAALEMLHEVRELSGDAFSLDLELGRTLLRLDRGDEACEALRRHLSRAELVGPAIEVVHGVFAEVGGEIGARTELQLWTSVAKQYTSHEALAMNFYAASAALDLGEASEALVWLRPYLKWRPPEPRAYFLEARCYHAVGRPEIARRRLRVALEFRPNDPAFRKLAVELGMEEER